MYFEIISIQNGNSININILTIIFLFLFLKIIFFINSILFKLIEKTIEIVLSNKGVNYYNNIKSKIEKDSYSYTNTEIIQENKINGSDNKIKKNLNQIIEEEENKNLLRYISYKAFNFIMNMIE